MVCKSPLGCLMECLSKPVHLEVDCYLQTRIEEVFHSNESDTGSTVLGVSVCLGLSIQRDKHGLRSDICPVDHLGSAHMCAPSSVQETA